jgi:hypothetical protein
MTGTFVIPNTTTVTTVNSLTLFGVGPSVISLFDSGNNLIATFSTPTGTAPDPLFGSVAAYSYAGATPVEYFVANFSDAALTQLEFSAAVPEPSTWAMMILGFLGIGFMTYRRRRALRC